MEVATAIKTKRLGSLPAFLALDSIDIGEAKLKGKKEKVIITLGRNLTEEDIKWYAEKNLVPFFSNQSKEAHVHS